jgi:hypothetical protein
MILARTANYAVAEGRLDKARPCPHRNIFFVPLMEHHSGLSPRLPSAHIPRMAPSAPTLTREKFFSLRDGAKGSMHRIPSEHKARLIELGYIEEVRGGIRLTAAGRARIAEG